MFKSALLALTTLFAALAKDNGDMDLQRVDPGIRGFENRVFECGRCYTMKAVPAAIGRTKSKWAESRLLSQREP
jgi:hypothetical protein